MNRSTSKRSVACAAAVLMLAGCGADEKPKLTFVLPAAQTEFVNIVSTAQTEGANVENDMQLGGVKAKRDSTLCSTLKTLAAEQWVGKVVTVDSNSDGKGVLAISIAPKIFVQTWNNAFSDMEANTMLEPGTPLFNTASRFKPGDAVVFSGRFFAADGSDCLAESSVRLRGKVREPEFVFRFSEIGPYVHREAPPVAATVPPTAAPEPVQAVPAVPVVVPAPVDVQVAPAAVAQPVAVPSESASAAAASASQPDTPLASAANEPAAMPERIVIRPSFDCAKASTLIEELICKDEALASQDVQLAAAYKVAQQQTSDKAALKAEQLEWLKNRRNKCSTSQCLTTAYSERLEKLAL